MPDSKYGDWRDSEWFHIVVEHDDGYGLVLWDHERGIRLFEFDMADNLYNEVHVNEEQLADVISLMEERLEEGEIDD